MNKLVYGFVLSIFLISFFGFVNSEPIINDLNITPELDISFFGNYTIFADINNYNILSVILDISGINGQGQNCWEYDSAGNCHSETFTYNMTYLDGNIWRKTLIRPDHIYPEIMFADSNITWYNTPLDFSLYRQAYGVFYIENPFIMDENMSFWVEFNTLAKANNSSDLYVYLVAKDQNLSLFTSDWRANSNVQLIATFNKNELYSHTHTENSGHILVPLTTNSYGNIGDKNIDISENFYLVLYQDATAINRGWNLKYHPSSICENTNNWYVGSRSGGTWSLPTYQNGCPDVHFHLARRINYQDGVSLSLTVEDNESIITYDDNFYFNELPNLPPNPTSFITPEIGASYGSNDTNIFISWNQSTDPNGDDLNYIIYLELWDEGSHPIVNTQDLNYTVQIPSVESLPDGQYSFYGEVCDYELCTDFYMDGNFVLDRTSEIYSLNQLKIYSDNDDNSIAIIGDTITLDFLATGELDPSLYVLFYINGELINNLVTQTYVDSYLYSFVVNENNSDGYVLFEIGADTLDKLYTDTLDGSYVIINNDDDNFVDLVAGNIDANNYNIIGPGAVDINFRYSNQGTANATDYNVFFEVYNFDENIWYELPEDLYPGCNLLNLSLDAGDSNYAVCQIWSDVGVAEEVDYNIRGRLVSNEDINAENDTNQLILTFSPEAFSFDGAGTLDDPYQISSCEDLNYVRNYLDANFILMQDINCYDTINWGELISGFCTNEVFSDEESCELNYGTWYADHNTGFEPIGDSENTFNASFDGNGYSIFDLTIKRFLNTDANVGLFGYTSSNAEIFDLNLFNVDVWGYHRTGALVGRNLGTINNVVVSGEVYGFYNYVGGIVGGSLGNIYDSNFDGNVFSEWDLVGGIVGATYGDINNCHSSGIVFTNGSSNDGSVGGLVGALGSGATINYSSSSSDVNGIYATGGLVGSAIGDIYNSFSTGIVYGNYDYTGGLVGSLEGDVNNCYSTSNVIQLNDFLGGYTGGLIGVSSVTSGKGRVYDSNASGTVNGVLRVGGLIGATDSNVYNSYAIGNVIGLDEKVGGLIGSMQNNFVYQSYSIGDVNGLDNVGGLIGYTLNSEVRECYSDNNLVVSQNLAGGLIGSANSSLIKNTYSSSNIDGYFVGGLIGIIQESFVSLYNSYSTGNVLGINQSGGLIGIVYAEDIHDSFTTSTLLDYSDEYMFAGAIGSVEDYELENIYWYDHYDSNLNCFAYIINDDFEFEFSDENCFVITDSNGIEYFYNAENAPLSNWDFTNVWQENENNYPTFKWQLNSQDEENPEETNNSSSSNSKLKVTTKGIFNNIKLNQTITFIIDKSGFRNIKHKLIVNKILLDENGVTFTLYSTPETYTLSIGETIKKDYDNDNYYDLSVKLLSITSNKASFELKAIHDEILLQETKEEVIQETTKPKDISETKTKDIIKEVITKQDSNIVEKPVYMKTETKNSYWYLWLIVILIALGLIGYFYFRR